MTEEWKSAYDVVVVGGGAAGLSGALMLARARRSVLVLDAGAPRNAPADGVHGLLGLDGTPPGELLERGRREVRRYGGAVAAGDTVSAAGDTASVAGDTVSAAGEVVSAGPAEGGFVVGTRDGRSVRARRLLVTTGLVDELPEVDGLRARWGRDVVHCPYCHGWEVRDRAVGVLACGPLSVHQALLFRQWSADVVLLAHTGPQPGAEEAEQLAARGIAVVQGEVAAVETAEDRLAGVRLADGGFVAREALAVAPRMVARAGFLDGLGLRPAEHPGGAGEYVPSDAAGRSAVPGVWVAGNVTDLAAQVGAAAAGAATAAASLNADLLAEDTRRAVEASRNADDER
ncbi:NAD(P)/FAD-dependent oxidoreductase [Streptomyces xiaopingdaonensis]|uniref:NAD(P)/FAD-dependent oxidoreductase n=1 Tax=Streptomyces xiaopingdaonensis TaxID=1565415 RepID=UPI00031AED1F|nr:NAD(P)/FAD-dependent oxidoreductase [Streptomyces xiaopingdaonensis]